jgi:hypothetical protein
LHSWTDVSCYCFSTSHCQRPTEARELIHNGSTIADLVIGCQNEDDAGTTGWCRGLTTDPLASWLCICFQVLDGAAMDEDGTREMRSDRQAQGRANLRRMGDNNARKRRGLPTWH